MRRWPVQAALTLVCLPALTRAQKVGFQPIVSLTSEADERIRLSQLSGRFCTEGYLIRSVSRLATLCDTSALWGAGIVGPEVRVVRNSGLPYSLNQGPLWASRGWNGEVTAGAFGYFGPVRAILAPTIVSEENKAFQVIPYPQNSVPARSVWANPFHPLPESIDLPLRFGDRSISRLDP
ncbi:MAG: hypothetical protein ACREPM_17020, partial [Gemmatimonadaceae bacterium]